LRIGVGEQRPYCSKMASQGQMYGDGRLARPAFTRNHSNRLHHARPDAQAVPTGRKSSRCTTRDSQLDLYWPATPTRSIVNKLT
jgi:hypothetical protein